MKIIFLGTNGWYDTKTGNTICILIKTRDYAIIFDAGNGFYKLDEYLSEYDGTTGYLFLSHFHLDHVEGLHMLNKVTSFERLVISGPKGTRAVLNTLVNKPFTVPISKLPYPVDVIELPDEGNRIPFYLESAPLLHSDLTLGYRIEIDEKVVVYCPDTGYCDSAVKLARNADLLITECAYRSGQTDPEWPHLNPEGAARIAKNANVKQLALVHFDASRYPSHEYRVHAQSAAQNIFQDTFATYDNMQIVI
jgi:ribonuclease BN (tRNA processing enzyme)